MFLFNTELDDTTRSLMLQSSEQICGHLAQVRLIIAGFYNIVTYPYTPNLGRFIKNVQPYEYMKR